MSDYERVAQVLRRLDEIHPEKPDLETLARGAGLSPFHFQRLFAAWAGVTPKRFLQCLTAAHARHLLRGGASVLDTALEVGLSGPGRLHDLCVSLEAASPGELKSGGAGWTIVAGVAESPFGPCLVACGPRGVCHVAFVGEEGLEGEWRALSGAWPCAAIERDGEAASALAARIFLSPREAQPDAPAPAPGGLRAYVRGTPFQVRVWRALLEVPAGSLVTYGALAAALGRPGAARAVGTAVGRNPLAYLIPCHRVIRETGVVGGYRWGRLRKRAMLAWESARRVEE